MAPLTEFILLSIHTGGRPVISNTLACIVVADSVSLVAAVGNTATSRGASAHSLAALVMAGQPASQTR